MCVEASAFGWMLADDPTHTETLTMIKVVKPIQNEEEYLEALALLSALSAADVATERATYNNSRSRMALSQLVADYEEATSSQVAFDQTEGSDATKVTAGDVVCLKSVGPRGQRMTVESIVHQEGRGEVARCVWFGSDKELRNELRHTIRNEFRHTMGNELRRAMINVAALAKVETSEAC